MPLIGTVKQQPNDVQDYDIDFTDWFPVDDFITEATVSVTPDDFPIPLSTAIGNAGKKVKVWVYAGGTAGTYYKVTVNATTNDGRKKEVEFKIIMRDD
jgi:molybdopterin biosynthesis enzyme MoaB